jgi:hypothetical protein
MRVLTPGCSNDRRMHGLLLGLGVAVLNQRPKGFDRVRVPFDNQVIDRGPTRAGPVR